MKQSLFIICVLIAYNSFAQGDGDSIAHVRKPVLRYLLQEKKRADFLTIEVKKIPELEYANFLLRMRIQNYKADSASMMGIISTADASAAGWKDTSEKVTIKYEAEVKKKNVWKWGGISIGAAGLLGGLYLATRR